MLPECLESENKNFNIRNSLTKFLVSDVKFG